MRKLLLLLAIVAAAVYFSHQYEEQHKALPATPPPVTPIARKATPAGTPILKIGHLGDSSKTTGSPAPYVNPLNKPHR